MKTAIGMAIAVGVASLAFGAEGVADAPKKQTTLSIRAGVYNEKQTFIDFEAEYEAPFAGIQLDGVVPFGARFSIRYLGVADLAYGTYSENGGAEDFDQNLFRLKAQAALAYAIPMGRVVVSPFAGLGTRLWHRGEGTGDSNGDGDEDTPYIEDWSSIYAVFGVRAEIKRDNGSIFAQIDVQAPLNEKISTSSSTDIEYEFQDEDESTMITAEVGFTTERHSISLFLESYKYSRETSDGTFALGLGLGDEVTATTFGGRFGFIF